MEDEMKKAALGVSVLLAVLTVPAFAQDRAADRSHALQCLIATSSLAGSGDKNAEAVGVIASMYFAGKVFGQDPTIDLTAAIKEEAAKLDGDSLRRLLVQCGAEMSERSKQMKAAGQALVEESKQPKRSTD